MIDSSIDMCECCGVIASMVAIVNCENESSCRYV